MKTIKRIIYTAVFLSSLFTAVHAQNIQLQSLDLVVMQMADYNMYETATTGFAGVRSKQWSRFEQLSTLGTEEALLQLATNHNNAVVRLYAYYALRQKGAAIPQALVSRFENDQSLITTVIGCFRSKKSIAFMVKSSDVQIRFNAVPNGIGFN